MKAHSKTGLALLILAFLLLSPSGACAATMPGSSQGHPCCPRTSLPAADCCSDFGYVKSQPWTTTVLSNDNQRPLAGPAVIGNPIALEIGLRGFRAVEPLLFAERYRFLEFHQLLI